MLFDRPTVQVLCIVGKAKGSGPSYCLKGLWLRSFVLLDRPKGQVLCIVGMSYGSGALFSWKGLWLRPFV